MSFSLASIFAPAAQKEVGILISMGILMVAFAVVVRMNFAFGQYSRWFKKAVRNLKKMPKDTGEFRNAVKDKSMLNELIKGEKAEKQGKVDDVLGHIWDEFTEHLIPDDQAWHNSQRPKALFHNDNGELEPHILGVNYHALPGYFVTIGLMLTFFSLAAVLNLIDTQNAETLDQQIGEALGTASFKFIISISGLLSSIFVSIAYRRRHSQLTLIIDEFNRELDKRFIFAQPRDKEQLAALHTINSNVAELKEAFKSGINADLESSIISLSNNLAMIVPGFESMSKSIEEATIRISSAFDKNIGEIAGKLEEVVEKISTSAEQLQENIDAAQEGFSGSTESFNDSSRRFETSAKILTDLQSQSPTNEAITQLIDVLRTVNQRFDTVSKQLENTLARSIENLADLQSQSPTNESIARLIEVLGKTNQRFKEVSKQLENTLVKSNKQSNQANAPSHFKPEKIG